jgi:hypothetical protein
MAFDTDPGIGIGTATGSGFPSGITPSNVQQGCVDFDRSLEILIMGNKAGAYGLKQPNICEVIMFAHQREGWIDKMRVASSILKRDLGAPLCPEEVYDELHPLNSSIRLRQSPVAYLGKQVTSAWLEVNLSVDPGGGKYVEICEGDLGGATIDEVQVSYPDAILECYTGLQALQTPCVTTIIGTCAGGDGYKLWWPDYQLVDPSLDETVIENTDDFITAVKYRTVSLDADAAYEYVGTCDCECCSTTPALTLTLEDATEGRVCINSCDVSDLCYCSNRQIRINYATAFSYGATMDPALEEALVLLALVRAGDTPAKPCGCDNSMINSLLEIDPTASTEFATKLSYGPTVAGMTVMRIVNKLLKRPHYNEPVGTGGLLSGRRVKKTNRDRSFLRG